MRKSGVISLSVVLALIVSAPCAWAQRPGGRGGFGGGFGGGASLLAQKSVQEELKLSEDQIKKVDEFLAKQLNPELFEAAARGAGYPLTLRRHAGYGHGYYFVSSVIEDHLRHHAECLDA